MKEAAVALLDRLLGSPGSLIAPITFLVLLFELQGTEKFGEEHHTAVVAMDVSAVALIAPLVALSAAWEGRKLRSSGALASPRQRSWFRISAGPIGVSFGPAAAVLVAYGAIDGPAMGTDWLILAWGVLTLASWAVAGFGLGCLLPPVVSLPLAFLVPSLWHIVARNIEPLWLRHLTGAWTGRYLMDVTAAAEPLIAAAVMSLGIGVCGALLTWAASLRDWRAGATPLVALLALLALALFARAAVILVQNFG